ATVLVGLNRWARLGISPSRLAGLAAELGSDVAFCLEGGVARAGGRGERLQRLTPVPDCRVVVVQPSFALSTPLVYRAWDERPCRVAPGCTQRMATALESGRLEEVCAALANDLEPAAERLRPELGAARAGMRQAGCQGVLLSGSGSCLFGLLPPDTPAEPVLDGLAGLGRVVWTRFRGCRDLSQSG
ncbi:MAG: 4-(cytidine 5'-diphospho)-2-C-methyl-D-erythritol kinase, partial [Candidatus Eremiobacterota bacterium]